MYENHLPNVFPYRLELPVELADEIASFLIQPRKHVGIPNGSSFAVTSNSPEDNMRIVWLSRTSYDSLPEEMVDKIYD